jgi:hypothetical protein
MLEFWLLDEIQDICRDANFADPLPAFKSLHRVAQEKGECKHKQVSRSTAVAKVVVFGRSDSGWRQQQPRTG